MAALPSQLHTQAWDTLTPHHSVGGCVVESRLRFHGPDAMAIAWRARYHWARPGVRCPAQGLRGRCGYPPHQSCPLLEIGTAREHGDLSENAEYHAAKDRQGMIEARISELESKIGLAEVIDISNLSSDRVQFGAKVTVVDEETEKESTYQIVGADEAEVNEGRLSVTSPLARALIGKKSGDALELNTPSGVRNYEILAIKYD